MKITHFSLSSKAATAVIAAAFIAALSSSAAMIKPDPISVNNAPTFTKGVEAVVQEASHVSFYQAPRDFDQGTTQSALRIDDSSDTGTTQIAAVIRPVPDEASTLALIAAAAAGFAVVGFSTNRRRIQVSR